MDRTSHADVIDQTFVEVLVGIALEAGKAVMDVYEASGGDVVEKADGSPVTEADKRAEAIILDGLRAIAPGAPIVAEEEAAAGRTPDVDAEFFLVDPLDGTKEFIRGAEGNGEFTVNIGLVRDGDPIAGVVYAPARGRIWAGCPGSAWTAEAHPRDGVGPSRPIRVRVAPPAGLTAVASRSHSNPETEAFLSRYDVVERKSAGSSLKFCLVAEGVADIYPRLGRTMEWDTAAGDAVLRAAGGQTLTFKGTPLLYGKRETLEDSEFANPHFIALGLVDLRSLR